MNDGFVGKFIFIDSLYKTQEKQYACDASLPISLPFQETGSSTNTD